jgi:DNA repair photolyase
MTTAMKGRGALSQPPGRFDKLTQTLEHDGWFEDEPERHIETVVRPEPARSIISRNNSPDIHFTQSINPYRGCEHGCSYCSEGSTPILMGNGSTKPLADLQVGDSIYGTERIGWYRRYVKTRVLAHWSVVKPAFRITLEDGTTLVTSGDHRLLTDRGWKHVTGAMSGTGQRPYLTVNNKLMGTGRFASAPIQDAEYRLGYLCGAIRGDAHLATHHYTRSAGNAATIHTFRLALCDEEALVRTGAYLQDCSIETTRFVFAEARERRRHMDAIRTSRRANVDEIRKLIEWPESPCRQWHLGFLAGIFDAEGSYSDGILRIPNTDKQIIKWIELSLRMLEFDYVVEHIDRTATKPIDVVRIRGGLPEHLRFFHSTGPAIIRKCDITGQAVKSEARLAVTRIEPLNQAMRLYDITTGTEDFIANGVVSHNCYARPSHAYVGLSPGLDFETKLFFKQDAAKLLEKELAAPSYKCVPIMIGANTDPYQPIEREHRVTRSLLEVLLRCRHPVTVTTKGALVARDVDLLSELARDGLVRVMFSIPSLSNDMKRVLEPRAASAAARLKAMSTLADAGVPVGVLVAPIIPVLTEHEVEDVLTAAREAGATVAGYTMLRLPWEVKDLFREWLAEHFPDRAAHVMSIVRGMRGERDNDPNFGTRMKAIGPFAELMRQRFRLACRRLGYAAHQKPDMPTNLFSPPRRTHPQMGLDLGP